VFVQHRQVLIHDYQHGLPVFVDLGGVQHFGVAVFDDGHQFAELLHAAAAFVQHLFGALNLVCIQNLQRTQIELQLDLLH